MTLADIPDGDLRAELARRDVAAAEAARPVPVEEPDYSRLVLSCQEYVRILAEDDHGRDDAEGHIAETAMMAVFGPNVYDWVNEQLG